MQNKKVVAYAFRQLKPCEQNYPTHDWELVMVFLHLRFKDISFPMKLVRYLQIIRA